MTNARLPLPGAIALAVSLAVGAAAADEPTQSSSARREFVKRELPAESMIRTKRVVPTQRDKETLQMQIAGDSIDDTTTFVAAWDRAGNLAGAVCFIDRLSTPHKDLHQIGISLKPDGTIKSVAFVGTRGEYPRRVANKTFLGQFTDNPGKPPLRLSYEIDALAGATESSQTVVSAVNAVLAVFRKYVMNQPAPPPQ